jgi:hypothetical protein
LGALAFDRRFNELDIAIEDIRRLLLANDQYVTQGWPDLRADTRKSLSDQIVKFTPDRIAEISERFTNYQRLVKADQEGTSA